MSAATGEQSTIARSSVFDEEIWFGGDESWEAGFRGIGAFQLERNRFFVNL
jgi:hypothetical protein